MGSAAVIPPSLYPQVRPLRNSPPSPNSPPHPVCALRYGTVTHQPPEALGDNIVGYAGDVYGFGVLLWQV